MAEKEKVDQTKANDSFAFKISPKLVEQNILRSPGPNEGVAPVPTGRTRITLPAPHGKGFSDNKAQIFVPDSAVQMNGDEPAVVNIDKGARIKTSTTADEGWRPAPYLQSVVESRLGKNAVVGFESPEAAKGASPDAGDDGPAGVNNTKQEFDDTANDKDYSEFRERVAPLEFNDASSMEFDDLENDNSGYDI